MNLLEVSLDKLRSILGTDPDSGLTAEQVLRNRKEFGENILYDKKNTVQDLLKKIFGDVMMILFLLVFFFDFVRTENYTSLFCMVIVALLYSSFVLGTHFYVSKIQKKIDRFCRSKYHVRRSGRIQSISKSELVPGDILLLEKGDVMPCDGIILKHSALKILEASVTGKRVPVFKRTHEEVEDEESGYPYFECILFAGSVVLHGSAKVFVCNTGTNIFDNENFTVSRQNTTVPQIYRTAMELKKQISLIWVIACFFLFSFGVFRGLDVFHSFYYVSAVVIAAFPGAIELLCDLSIAHMTDRLFRKGVVLRNAGSIDRLCDVNCVFVNSSDYLFYSQPLPGSCYLGEEFFDFKNDKEKAALLLENLILAQSKRDYYAGKLEEWKVEKVILSAAAQIGIQKTRLDKEHLYINQYNFDPKLGYSCSLTLHNNQYRLVIRGNPNSVLSACGELYRDGSVVPMNETLRASLRANARHLAGLTERMIAVAYLNLSSPSTGDQRSLCRGMTYLGIFGLSTPISAAAANSVSVCQKSGIQTYLLTDDYPETVAALSKSVSIIGEGDYQYALSYQTYERMDRGIFLADIEKYKAYCGFPVEEKQSIVRFHKENGDITLSLTGGIYDTLPQMESDISVVGIDEKQNAVRLNADLLLKEKKYEVIPFCINWARILYRNIVHVMQYTISVQVALGLFIFLSYLAHAEAPFSCLPLLIAGLGAVLPSGINIFHRVPGPHLEDNVNVLKEDRVTSLQALIIVPFITGAAHAVASMLAYRVALFASGGSATASFAGLLCFVFASYFTSMSIKFDSLFLKNRKHIGKSALVTLGISVLSLVCALCYMRQSVLTKESFGSGVSLWIVFFAFLFSLLPAVIGEWMKFLNMDDSAKKRDS